MEAQLKAPAPPLSDRPSPSRFPGSTSRKRLWADRAAAWIVTAGGLVIIASILGILLFIVGEVLPLMRGAAVHPGPRWTLEGAPPGAMVIDEHRTHAALLLMDGRLRVLDLATGKTVFERPVLGDTLPVPFRRIGTVPGQQLMTGSTEDGRIVAVPVDWQVSFVGSTRKVEAHIPDPVVFEMDPSGEPVRVHTARVAADGAAAAAAWLADGRLAVLHRSVTTNPITEETTASWSRFETDPERPLEILLLDAGMKNLFGATSGGELIWWPLGEGAAKPQFFPLGQPITALSLLIGDRSLVVGQASGALSLWFPVRQTDESFRLTLARDLPPLSSAVTLLAPSMRDKGFLAQDAAGRIGLYYSTSARQLWSGASPLPDARALFFAPKGNGAFVADGQSLVSLEIDNPHPEISLRALFGKVWYESYDGPEYVWQSTGGTDDFEPKLSLTPLLVGTLKGTFYSLILAIPLAVLGAMYTSQFTDPRLKRYVKPTVEIMAALPSVVLGFLAGLWLAPRLERVLPAMILALVVLPALVLATGYAWRSLPQGFRGRFVTGWELVLYTVVIVSGLWVCLSWNDSFEHIAFGGNIREWLLETTGLRYDQRNAIVVGLAMGFAVIPIIFSIAEDAFSNVPRNLVSGSLALGANRWQTVTRVVLPTASPGIFSAIMIGFGRAVGETMIVLMATGNTPIMDWNPFAGFRTLSANIAVEIPEAPHGGTLYRTLFLAALLLFILTFAVNTAAEIVRQRLRKRYAAL